MKRYQQLFEKSFEDTVAEGIQEAIAQGLIQPPSPEMKQIIADLKANLYHGPSVGSWSEDQIDQVRDWVMELPTIWYDHFSGFVSEQEPRPYEDEETGEMVDDDGEWYEIDSAAMAKYFLGRELAQHIR